MAVQPRTHPQKETARRRAWISSGLTHPGKVARRIRITSGSYAHPEAIAYHPLTVCRSEVQRLILNADGVGEVSAGGEASQLATETITG